MPGPTLVGNNRKLSYVGHVEPACPRVWTLNAVSLAPTRKVYRLIRSISQSGGLASTLARVRSRCRFEEWEMAAGGLVAKGRDRSPRRLMGVAGAEWRRTLRPRAKRSR